MLQTNRILAVFAILLFLVCCAKEDKTADVAISEKETNDTIYMKDDLIKLKLEEIKEMANTMCDTIGRGEKWSFGNPIIYVIDKSSFDDIPNGYEIVAEHMETAALDWQGLTNICFFHLGSFEDFSNTGKDTSVINQAHFIIRSSQCDTSFAEAFFPENYEQNKPQVLRICPAFFVEQSIQVGLLRHELGHILGYRHPKVKKNTPSVPSIMTEPIHLNVLNLSSWFEFSPVDSLIITSDYEETILVCQ